MTWWGHPNQSGTCNFHQSGTFVTSVTFQSRCISRSGVPFIYHLNQYSRILVRNSAVIEYPDADPKTESTPQYGQRAVCPVLLGSNDLSSYHSLISGGEKIEMQ